MLTQTRFRSNLILRITELLFRMPRVSKLSRISTNCPQSGAIVMGYVARGFVLVRRVLNERIISEYILHNQTAYVFPS